MPCSAKYSPAVDEKIEESSHDAGTHGGKGTMYCTAALFRQCGRFAAVTGKEWGGHAPLTLTESRRYAAGRISANARTSPRSVLYSCLMPYRHCSVRFLSRNFFSPSKSGLSGVLFLSLCNPVTLVQILLRSRARSAIMHTWIAQCQPPWFQSLCQRTMPRNISAARWIASWGKHIPIGNCFVWKTAVLTAQGPYLTSMLQRIPVYA